MITILEDMSLTGEELKNIFEGVEGTEEERCEEIMMKMEFAYDTKLADELIEQIEMRNNNKIKEILNYLFSEDEISIFQIKMLKQKISDKYMKNFYLSDAISCVREYRYDFITFMDTIRN